MEKNNKKTLAIILGVVGVLALAVVLWWFLLRGSSSSIDFSLIPVKQGSGEDARYGYVDHKGKMVINPQFYEAYIFSDGLALVKDKEGKYGYIDKKGKMVINNEFKGATGFSEGLAFVVREGEVPVCINTSGKEMFRCEGNVDCVFSFSEGLALFSNKEEKVGYMNRKGEFVINPQFKKASKFHEGLAAVYNGDKWGFVNKKGEIVINYQFEEVTDFSNGLAAFTNNGDNWGYINKKGEYVINPQFDKASQFIGDYAIIESNDSYGIIDKKGNYVANPQFDEIACVAPGTLFAVAQSDKFGFVDATGKYIINPQFDFGIFLEKNFAIVETDDLCGFIDNKGKYLCNPQFENFGELRLIEGVRSDYYDASKIIAKLFEGWDAAHLRDGINSQTTYGQLEPLSGRLDYYDCWQSENTELTDNAELGYILHFDRSVRSYDSYYNLTYDANAKVTAINYELALSGEAWSHASNVAKAVANKIASLYGVKLETKTHEYSTIYYSLDGNVGIMVRYTYGEVWIGISFSKEINDNWKTMIENPDEISIDTEVTEEAIELPIDTVEWEAAVEEVAVVE